MTVGNKIYSLRKKEGISQEELANRIDVSRQAISKWEQDLTIPDTVNLIKLCGCFSVPLEYLTDEKSTAEAKNTCKKENVVKKRAGLILCLTGGVLAFITFIAAYFMKIAEYRVLNNEFVKKNCVLGNELRLDWPCYES